MNEDLLNEVKEFAEKNDDFICKTNFYGKKKSLMFNK